ncbi:MAG TPA: type II toxin-antitoxin system RelE/ParE family toxin [Blastocatellia bacterium]|nr:type II toxin-antitoxin system RelE/ParE family toxin [Blastocatellia bacterium]
MKPLVINDEAADELDEAIRYYENKCPGIGVNFSDRVSEAFHRIQRNPQLYPFHKDTRVQKCLTKRFPYTVFYLELDDTLWLSQLHIKNGGRIIGNSDNQQ